MNYFETVKTVLDATLARLCANRCMSVEDGQRLLATHLKTMSDEWFSGAAPNIAYGDPFCRLAYLYCHVAVNANVCEMVIRRTPAARNMIIEKMENEEDLRVCAFGGGPGTELLALAKYLHKTYEKGNPPLSISFTILDSVQEWAESWSSLQRAIDRRMKAIYPKPAQRPFIVSNSFNSFDMTCVSEYAALDEYLQHDLYIMNYVVSELLEKTDDFADLIKRMADSAPSGAVFLVIDREQDRVISLINKLLKQAGLTLVGDPGKDSGNMDSDEESSTLEPYVSAIGRRPRVQWGGSTGKGVFWVVARKA